MAAVDAQADPEPPKRYTIRVRGEVIDLPIPRIQKVENRARRWMVSQEWLAHPDNQKFDVPGFVVDNGKAWGEPKDPEETISAQKRVKLAKQDVAARKRARLAEDGKGKQGSGKKKAQSKKIKDKGKAKAVDIEEPEPKNQEVVQPVASTSTAHQVNDDSDFDD
jgi:hypothetical protein